MGLFDQFGRPIKAESQSESSSGTDVPSQNTKKDTNSTTITKTSKVKELLKKHIGISGASTVTAFLLAVLNVSCNGLFNFFSDVPGFQLYPFAFACCLLVFWIFHKVILNSQKPNGWYLIPSFICIVVLVLSIWAVHVKNNPLMPHLKLALRVNDEKQPLMELTNDFVTFDPDLLNPSNVIGFLIIPYATNEQSKILRFFIVNDSLVSADQVEVGLSIASDMEYWPSGRLMPDNEPGWKRDINPKNTIPGLNSFVFVTERHLRGNNEGSPLPDLLFQVPARESGYLIFHLSANRMQETCVAFRVCFIDRYGVLKPKLARGKMVNGMVNISFTADQ